MKKIKLSFAASVGIGALALALVLPVSSVHAQAILSTLSYTQNFDTLATTGATNTFTDNSTIPALYAYQTSGQQTVPTYSTGTGSSTTGDVYSFGTAGSTERALGSVASSGTGGLYYAFVFTNSTGSDLSSFTFSYTGEQWRVANATAQSLTFGYKIDATGAAFSNAQISNTATGYTAVSALNFTSPINSATASALNGNAAANRLTLTSTVTVSIPQNSTMYFRLVDLDDSGTDDGLAFDDLSISFAPVAGVPEPSTYALALGGLGGLALMRFRRRHV